MDGAADERAELWVRLRAGEIEIVDSLAEGARKSEVVEEALRRFLRVVDSSGKFIQRSRSGIERRRLSLFAQRRYFIDKQVFDDLQRIATEHKWSRQELIRQAILTLGEQS